MANDIVLAENLELVTSYQKAAMDYGLYSKKVAVAQPGDAPKEYLVFSLNPIGDDVNPVAIINRNHRNTNIFYPESYAVELPPENPLLMWEGISGYLAHAEMMYELYEEFGVPMPKAIRVDEAKALMSFYEKARNPAFDDETRKDYQKGLQAFFKNETPKTKFKKQWQEFYRSEMYDASGSFLQNLFTFLKRNEPEISLDAMLESSDDLKQVSMPEHQYKEFREIIKARHPEVKYSVGEVQIVDEGVLVDPDTGEHANTPYGITVTEEEFNRIKEERFAVEGHGCLDGLTPSYFESRNVVYKASDENIIASVAQEIAYRWAKCASLEDLEQYGELCHVEVPPGYLMNFYVGMMASGIPFYIDHDVNSKPKFEAVRIVYNTCHQNTVRNILVGLTLAQVQLAHLSINQNDVMFDIDVKKVDALIQQAKARALENSQGNVALIEEQGRKTSADYPLDV